MSLNQHRMSTKCSKHITPIGVMVTVGLVVAVGLFGFKIISKDNPSREAVALGAQNESTAIHEAPTPEKETTTQAASFYRDIKAGLQQPRLFPFQPMWSTEQYDPAIPVDSEVLAKLKRHVMLRNFYSSNARLTPEFRQLFDLLTDWNIQQNPDILSRLFDSVRATELLRESLVENQELVDPTVKMEVLEILQQDKIHLAQMVQEMLGIESPAFIDSLMEIRPRIGFGRPDTRIEPGEYLLIR